MSGVAFGIDPRYRPLILVSLLVFQLVCAVVVVTVYASALLLEVDALFGSVNVILGSISTFFVIGALALYFTSELSPKGLLTGTGLLSCLWIGDIAYSAVRLHLSQRTCLQGPFSPYSPSTDISGVIGCSVYWWTFGAGSLMMLDYLVTIIYSFGILTKRKKKRNNRASSGTIIMTLPPPGTPPINMPRMQVVDYSTGKPNKFGDKKVAITTKSKDKKLPLIGLTPSTPTPQAAAVMTNYEEQPEEFYKQSNTSLHCSFAASNQTLSLPPSYPLPERPSSSFLSPYARNERSASPAYPFSQSMPQLYASSPPSPPPTLPLPPPPAAAALPPPSPTPPSSSLPPNTPLALDISFLDPAGSIRRISSSSSLALAVNTGSNAGSLPPLPEPSLPPTAVQEVSPTNSLALQNFDLGVEMRGSSATTAITQSQSSPRSTINTGQGKSRHNRKSSGLREVFTASSGELDSSLVAEGKNKQKGKKGSIVTIVEESKHAKHEQENGREQERRNQLEFSRLPAQYRPASDALPLKRAATPLYPVPPPLLEDHPALRRHSAFASIPPLITTKSLPPLPPSEKPSTYHLPRLNLDLSPISLASASSTLNSDTSPSSPMYHVQSPKQPIGNSAINTPVKKFHSHHSPTEQEERGDSPIISSSLQSLLYPAITPLSPASKTVPFPAPTTAVITTTPNSSSPFPSTPTPTPLPTEEPKSPAASNTTSAGMTRYLQNPFKAPPPPNTPPIVPPVPLPQSYNYPTPLPVGIPPRRKLPPTQAQLTPHNAPTNAISTSIQSSNASNTNILVDIDGYVYKPPPPIPEMNPARRISFVGGSSSNVGRGMRSVSEPILKGTIGKDGMNLVEVESTM